MRFSIRQLTDPVFWDLVRSRTGSFYFPCLRFNRTCLSACVNAPMSFGIFACSNASNVHSQIHNKFVFKSLQLFSTSFSHKKCLKATYKYAFPMPNYWSLHYPANGNENWLFVMLIKFVPNLLHVDLNKLTNVTICESKECESERAFLTSRQCARIDSRCWRSPFAWAFGKGQATACEKFGDYSVFVLLCVLIVCRF